ncbi:hypothetical protein MRX96_053318 [Rhipicephalus microplus]
MKTFNSQLKFTPDSMEDNDNVCASRLGDVAPQEGDGSLTPEDRVPALRTTQLRAPNARAAKFSGKHEY